MKEDSIVFAEESSAALPRARAHYLAQAIQLEEHSPRRVITLGVLTTIFLLVSLFTFGGLTRVSEVAIADGEVIPAGLIQNVQHLEGGIVTELHVRNGDRVKAGDILVIFATSASESELKQMLVRQASFTLQGERLQALIEQREPSFGALPEEHRELAEKQRTIYLAQVNSFNSELAIIDSQIEQRRSEISGKQNQVASLRKELVIYQEQVAIREELSKKGTVSRTELLGSRSRLAEARSEQRKAMDDVIVARTAYQESKQRRLELYARKNQEIELEAGTVANELAEVSSSLIRLRDRVKRLRVRAPVSGIVQGLSISSVNEVVAPGHMITQIVPVQDELIIEARIKPQDIGHVHTGQTAKVKFTSYDSARFGSLDGTVDRLSASTYLDDEHNPYYRAELKLERNYLGDNSEQLKILPGMTVTADIRTGEKSILDYLMKPVTRGFSNAFKER
ncbi:MAG: HlyD family type I secretion periplasmic adaptor subunit [Sedimenticola sp.]